ncbi:hypothetical protein MKW92_033622 [Papaver armeniacum]|nr:hypothetical protein MKW92_033622 [Papaver armeniacum]
MESFNKTTETISFPILLHFLLFLLISIILCALSSHACHEEERRALLSFKSSLNDPANLLSTWQESFQHRNCCAWYGIKCSDESHHVVSINLRNDKLEDYVNGFLPGDGNHFDPPINSLTGNLSPSLVSINQLEYLDLAFNDFQESEIPFRFSKLTKLTHIDLSHTNVSSPISTAFTNVSSLQYLDLSCERTFLYYTPTCLASPSTKWIRGLVNLQVLRLSGINLFEATSSKETFSQDISYLWNLRELDVSHCKISSPVFPIHEFHNLTLLSILRMHENEINSSIPVQLANLTCLSILDLSSGDLQGSIPYLPNLKELDVSHNPNLHSHVIRMFEHPWPKLQNLQISYTNVSASVPSSISNAPLLVSFSASKCSIGGALPFSIYHLSRLQHLDLSYNNITGSIDSSISNLKYLNFLRLSHNNLHGYIPNSICKISPLQHLDLEYNNITGTLPSFITKLRNLNFLSVSHNSIQGTVSLISLINELNLTMLDLSPNKLTVVIDQHLYPSKFNLERLDLHSCNMKGCIPTFICNFTRLKYVDFSDNNLTGTIPFCIFDLKKLKVLDLSKNRIRDVLPLLPQGADYAMDLSHNQLHGEISKENVEILSTFGNIMLNNNELSGSIPSSICSHKPGMPNTKTDYIDLSNNKLSGIIPSSIGSCSSLTYLNLGNNNLTGNVPNELKHTNMYYLQLNDNNLNGPFPMFILELLYLSVLNLGNNNFDGTIPSGLGSMDGLQFLSLRSNRFNGSIPEDISHLQQLQILDLSLNNFSGPITLKLGNFSWLTSRLHDEFAGDFSVEYQLATKGSTAQFEQMIVYNSGIDLSCNILDGNIPEEIGLLQGLAMLNLSHNLFSSNIPVSVGNMSSLESLDLSSNRFSGHIPQSLTSIDTLGYLNLSYNNLSGKIPTGNHFDTLSLDGSAFAGNKLLCGLPTEKKCPGDHNASTNDTNPSRKVDEDDRKDSKERFLLYAIVAMGFVVGFWGLFLVLLLKKQKWWFPYWGVVGSIAVKIVEGCIQKK